MKLPAIIQLTILIAISILPVTMSGCQIEEGEGDVSIHQAVASLPEKASVIKVITAPEGESRGNLTAKTSESPAIKNDPAPSPPDTGASMRQTVPSPAPDSGSTTVNPAPSPSDSGATANDPVPAPSPPDSGSTGHNPVPSPTPPDSGGVENNPMPSPSETEAIENIPTGVPSPSPTMCEAPNPVPTVDPDPSPTKDFGTIVTRTVREQAQGARHIDLVLCLDVSGSMGPLIESAKQKLWEISKSIRSMDQKPTLRIALISFGSCTYSERTGWVRLETDFSSDMNRIYDRLSRLSADGENEYVARVIRVALNNLQWSKKPDTLRVMFIAGNESVYQDPYIDLDSICHKARERGIVINPIYCAHPFDTTEYEWEELASLGGGKFAAIELTEGMFSIGFPMPTGFPTNIPQNFPIKLPQNFPKNFPINFPFNTP